MAANKKTTKAPRSSAYLLYHTHETKGGNEDVKLLGVFSTRSQALSAQKRAVRLPGFRDSPSGFLIDKHELDAIQWQDGFVIANREGNAFDLPTWISKKK